MAESQRDLYLSDPLHHLEHSNHDAVIPPWLVAEAGIEDSWEKEEKAKLEVGSWAREFRNKFLEATKTENRQTISVWEPEKAAAWLKGKFSDKDGKFDHAKAVEVLEAAQCVDEKRTEVMSQMAEFDEKQPKEESGSPTRDFHKVSPPPTAAAVLEEASEAKGKLLKRKAVGSYGIILDEISCQLYRKGEKLAEVSTEDCGGYGILASELDSMDAEKDVVAFFDLKDDLEDIKTQGWFTAKAAPIVDNTALQRLDQEPGPDPNMGFDKANLPPRPDSSSPGPASLNPGSSTPVAPQIPGQDGK